MNELFVNIYNGCLGYIPTYDFDCKQITWTTDGVNAGTIFLREGKHNCTNVCGTLQLKDCNYSLKFFMYLLQYLTDYYKRPDINGAKIMNNEMAQIVLCVPPAIEQKRISDKEKLIKLLREYRQSIISETVTKGLDKKVQMKHSGIEWIGDIPVDWETAKLKYITSQPLMYGANEIGENEGQSSTRYIRITDIDDSGNLKTDTFKSLSPEKAKPYLLNIGDILFARSGSVGKTYFHKYGKACFAGYFVKFSPNITMVYPKYVYYITLSNGYKNWIQMSSIQVTIKNISAEKYNNFSIPLPSLKIQRTISDFLDKKTSHIDNLIENITKQTKKLQEYRKSIIGEAVTGKAAI
ncbi:hypothetical protein AGMMS49573_01900 [Endomicrobiia bacterium]|nr:hypothetical protein AGMMS49573_01900 [Endomicrobiia bacterium]